MKCDMCKKEGFEAKDGIIANVTSFDTCFICNTCIMENQTRTIEELVLMINGKLKMDGKKIKYRFLHEILENIN